MHPTVRRYLDDLVDAARDVLGDDLVGAYAAGSVALDAYQPGRSDVDVALVVADRLDVVRRRELVARLRHEALPCPARGLELVVYTRAVAGSGTPEPGFEVELNTGARMPFRATLDPADRPAPDGRFWYGLDRSILHQTGYALLGPPAAQVFADLDPGDLRRLLVEALRWWLALPGPAGSGPEEHGPAGGPPLPGAEDAVLGACRSLVRLRDGVWLSKVAAGRRVAASGAYPDLIARCVAARSGGTPPGGAQARDFQRWVLRQVLDLS
ncbi:nucleotidyltransferase domain-containing protein [Micromonospora coxensis]|uniref:nucleotidyltransferase domain-containing protein n=1 Tax=Micromonospora coxensis TaxID=356852 RepID=UPI0034475C6B